MVKLLKAEFDIFAFEKHKGSTGGLQGTTNADGADIQTQNIKPDRTKTISF